MQIKTACPSRNAWGAIVNSGGSKKKGAPTTKEKR